MPRVLVNRAPLTDNDSSTWVWISASWRWRAPVSAFLVIATLRVDNTAGGRTSAVMRASCQSRATMATAAATAVVRFEATEVAVLVTTLRIAAMSLVMRDWISPPRVRLKKSSDWSWRWAKTATRRECMTRCPMEVANHVWTTLSRPETAATATMPTVAHTRRSVSRLGRASSMTRLIRKGCARPTIDVAMMRTVTRASGRACGRKSSITRRGRTGDSSSWRRSLGSTFVAFSGRPMKPALMFLPLKHGDDARTSASRGTSVM